MAKLKNKKVEETKVAEDLNQDEVVVIKENEKNLEDTGASTEKMRKTTALLSNLFNLNESYRVTTFDDKDKVVKASFENRDFTVTIQVKDCYKQGLAFTYEDAE